MPGTCIPRGENASSDIRRSHPRYLIPFACNLFYVDLGHGNPVTVLNLSEGGLAVKAITSSIDGFFPRIRFTFSKSGTWVQTCARVVWTDESQEVAGIEFVRLTDAGRFQIREWLGEIYALRLSKAAEATTIHYDASDTAEPVVGLAFPIGVDRESLSAKPRVLARPHREAVRTGKGSRRTPYLSDRNERLWLNRFLLLCAFALVLFSLSLYSGRARIDRWRAHAHSAAEGRFPTSKIPLAEIPAQITGLADPSGPSQLARGFVLQTAAMAHEENAEALADLLRKRNFPAFVFKSDSDHFYRVYVGPYSDDYAAAKIENELVRQGFEAILKRWSPAK
jgi:hypothetical protein